MTKLSFLGAVAAAALLCMSPYSPNWSPAKGGSLSFVLETANAADLEIPAYRRAHRYGYSDTIERPITIRSVVAPMLAAAGMEAHIGVVHGWTCAATDCCTEHAGLAR